MNYANKNIQNISSYFPPLEGRRKFEGRLLDFNEKTISPSPKVIKALKDFAKSNQIQIYPEYSCILRKIAKYARVKKNQLMITNGSDQGIDLIFRTFTQQDEEVIIPSPSFPMFFQSAKIIGCKIISPKYEKNGDFPFKETFNLIKKDTKLVVICNPNNPTGTIVQLKEIKEILKKALKNKSMVYVDEAYFEFSKITATKFIEKYPNLIITRTFSKAFGLASLRIGYLLSSKENIKELIKVRGPYDVNMSAVVGAKAALENLESLNIYVDEVMNKSKPMVEEFFRERNICFLPSYANFILFKVKNTKIYSEKLKDKGFLTRPRTEKEINDCIRLTIGTVSQMKKFINKFKYA